MLAQHRDVNSSVVPSACDGGSVPAGAEASQPRLMLGCGAEP
jgi:hypothetical protein